MKKQIQISCACLLLLAGCSSKKEETTVPKAPVNDASYTSYSEAIEHMQSAETYTVAVDNSYEMSYSDSTMSAYDMDGVLKVGKDATQYTQNIDANGLRSSFSGDYYDGRLYTSYNGVQYYEDMSSEEMQQVLLVPLQPVAIPQESIDGFEVSSTSSETSYSLSLKEDALKDIFLDRYDKYGLDQYDDFAMNSGTIEDTFDSEGRFLSETTKFTCTVTLSGETVDVTFTSSVHYTQLDSTEVTISSDTKKEESQYVAAKDIDTSTIQTLTDDDDSPEKTTTATFKKRLQNRLNYTIDEDGNYVSSFNNNNEEYSINFDKHVFEYSNRTIHYMYNWKSDQGSMSACTLDFTNDVQSSDCKDSTVETIREVKGWFQMELYYCGLTLEDLQKEAG